MVCGTERVRAKFLKLLRVRGEFKFCGAGADTKFQPAQDSTVHARNWHVKNVG